jgi:hypothetical protein
MAQGAMDGGAAHVQGCKVLPRRQRGSDQVSVTYRRFINSSVKCEKYDYRLSTSCKTLHKKNRIEQGRPEYKTG